jgi:UDP-N-acetylglucosamine--N-acetylmuramyl-(pentapeptide) pyrophosphoryl-undecaprenol N-acetylglucosamine transferase
MSGLRILFAGGGTGGHLYPALNLANALCKTEPMVECFFLGARRGIEARVLPGAGYNFRLLPMHPFYRERPWRNWKLAARIPSICSGVHRTFRDFNPELVVGTGGYVSGPALGWARVSGCKVALQEQNAEPGLTTRLFAPYVDQIHLGYPEAERSLRVGKKTEVHTFGNPVAMDLSGSQIDSAPSTKEPDFDWPLGKVLLVVGGSQGARGLNQKLLVDLELMASNYKSESKPSLGLPSGRNRDLEMASALVASQTRAWPDRCSIVWVTGQDHAEDIGERVRALPWADRIQVAPYIHDLGRQLDRVTLALSRSGAMFVAELCGAGRPSVLVPYPAAAGAHQTANARALADVGAAEVREEWDLAPGELWNLCCELLADESRLHRMSEAARERGAPGASLDIAETLLTLLDRNMG